MARKRQVTPARKAGGAKSAKLMADQAAALARYAAQALMAAGQLRIKTKPVGGLTLQAGERDALSGLSAVPAKVKKKMAKEGASFTVAEVAGLTTAVAESLPGAEPKRQA